MRKGPSRYTEIQSIWQDTNACFEFNRLKKEAEDLSSPQPLFHGIGIQTAPACYFLSRNCT